MFCAHPEAVDADGEQTRARAALYFESLASMGYKAVHVTTHELVIGVEPLRELGRRHRIPLLSASIVRRSDPARAVFAEAIVHDLGGIKVGFVGVLSAMPPGKAKWILHNELDILPVEEAARRGVAAARAAGAARVVVLSKLKRPEIDRMIEAVPGIDAILGSDTGDATAALEAVGPAVYADAYQKGKAIGVLKIFPGPADPRWRTEDARAGLSQQRLQLLAQLDTVQLSLSREGTALDAAQRQALEQEAARLRARIGQVQQAIDEAATVPKGATVVRWELATLDAAFADDPGTKRRVEAYKAKHPQAPGH